MLEKKKRDVDYHTESGPKVAEAFLKDIREHRLDDAYARTTSEFQNLMPRATFETFINENPFLSQPLADTDFAVWGSPAISESLPGLSDAPVFTQYSGRSRLIDAKQWSVTMHILQERRAEDQLHLGLVDRFFRIIEVTRAQAPTRKKLQLHATQRRVRRAPHHPPSLLCPVSRPSHLLLFLSSPGRGAVVSQAA